MRVNTSDSYSIITSPELRSVACRRLTEAEILQAFPDAASVIETKLIELHEASQSLSDIIQQHTAYLKSLSLDEMSEWVGLRWLDVNAGEDLRHIEKDMRRLRRQLDIATGRPLPPGSITYDMIQQARDFPISDLVDTQQRRRGKTIACLCPFHEDRNPSFHIYVDQNRGWCFGCNQGGDAISVAMRIHECSFKEAVLMLVGGGA